MSSAFAEALIALTDAETDTEGRRRQAPAASEAAEEYDSFYADDAERAAAEEEEEALLFISRLPPLHACTPAGREAAVPPKRPDAPPVTLVLDLDETLVHSSLEAPAPSGPRPDFSFPVHFEGVHHLVHVRRRPGLRVRARERRATDR